MLVSILASAVVKTNNMVITPGASVPALTDKKARVHIDCTSDKVKAIWVNGTMFSPLTGGKTTAAEQSTFNNTTYVTSYDCAFTGTQDATYWLTVKAKLDDDTYETVQFPMTYMIALGQETGTSKWLPIGEGTITENILAGIPGFENYGTQSYKVEIERKLNTEGLYRIKNIFANNPKMAGLTPENDYYVYFNLPVDATNPTMERSGSVTWNDFMIPMEIPGLNGTLVIGSKHMASQVGILPTTTAIPSMNYNRETRVANYGTSLQATVVGSDTKTYSIGKMVIKMPQTINVIAKADKGGTVKATTKGSTKTYIAGTAGTTVAAYDLTNGTDEHYVNLTATSNSGYNFSKWVDASGNEVSTKSSFDYYPTKDETLTAVFEKLNTLSWNVENNTGWEIGIELKDYFGEPLTSGNQLYYGFSSDPNCDDKDRIEGKYITLNLIDTGWALENQDFRLQKVMVNGSKVETGLLDDGITHTIAAKYLLDNPTLEIIISENGPVVNLSWVASNEIKRAGLEEPYMFEITHEWDYTNNLAPTCPAYNIFQANPYAPSFGTFDFEHAPRMESGDMINPQNGVLVVIPYETYEALTYEYNCWNVLYAVHSQWGDDMIQVKDQLSYSGYDETPGQLNMVMTPYENDELYIDEETGEPYIDPGTGEAMRMPRLGVIAFEIPYVDGDIDILFNAFKEEMLDIKNVGEELNSTNAPAVYYNINGVRVNPENLPAGVYIKRVGEKAEKVYIQK